MRSVLAVAFQTPASSRRPRQRWWCSRGRAGLVGTYFFLLFSLLNLSVPQGFPPCPHVFASFCLLGLRRVSFHLLARSVWPPRWCAPALFCREGRTHPHPHHPLPPKPPSHVASLIEPYYFHRFCRDAAEYVYMRALTNCRTLTNCTTLTNCREAAEYVVTRLGELGLPLGRKLGW